MVLRSSTSQPVVSFLDLLRDYPLHELFGQPFGLELRDVRFMTVASEFWTAVFHDSTAPCTLHKSAVSSDFPDFVARAGFRLFV